MKALLSMRQVAARLGFGRTKTYELLVSGEIPSIRIGDGPKARYRVEADVLDRWIAARRSSSTGRSAVVPERSRKAELAALGLDESNHPFM